MSCEIRSMITSYFLGSSIRIPPIFTNSPVTPAVFIELILSTRAGGKVFSIQNRMPIFLAIIQILYSMNHSDRPLYILDGRDARRSTKNTFLPSAATTANHACCYPRKYPANGEYPCHGESPTSLRSRPGTCPNLTIPAQSSSAGSGSETIHRWCGANSRADY